jgi:hypothetical protein
VNQFSSPSIISVENPTSIFPTIHALTDANPTSSPRLSPLLSTAPVGNRENRPSITPKRPLVRIRVFPTSRFLNRVHASTVRLACTSPRYPLFHAQRVLLLFLSLISLCFLEASLALVEGLVILTLSEVEGEGPASPLAVALSPVPLNHEPHSVPRPVDLSCPRTPQSTPGNSQPGVLAQSASQHLE